jgi:uncharacterized phage protein gp47/JayE
MTVYIDPPIETDPEELATTAYDAMAVAFPGWVPNAGNLDTILIEIVVRMAAEARTVASAVPTSIFRYLGELLGVIPVEATAAYVTSTWTAQDDAGYTIPAGTQVGIRLAGDELVGFYVTQEVVIPASSTATAEGEVVLQAALEGAEGSGLGGDTVEAELIDALAWVTTVVLEGITTGGTDAETDEEYLNRLASQLLLLSPRPIIPRDFEILARSVAGVERAMAIDGYNPGDQSSNNERMVAVAVMDESGAPCSGTVKTNTDTYLQSLREVNFVVNVIDPTSNEIDVDFTAHAYETEDPEEVEAAAIAAVEEYLSPANWGKPILGDQRDWRNVLTVRYLEIAEVILRTAGLDYIDTLTLCAHEGTPATDNVTLTGVAPVTAAGTITGAVS